MTGLTFMFSTRCLGFVKGHVWSSWQDQPLLIRLDELDCHSEGSCVYVLFEELSCFSVAQTVLFKVLFYNPVTEITHSHL